MCSHNLKLFEAALSHCGSSQELLLPIAPRHMQLSSASMPQAAEDEAAASELVPTARVLVLLTDGRVDSYQVC